MINRDNFCILQKTNQKFDKPKAKETVVVKIEVLEENAEVKVKEEKVGPILDTEEVRLKPAEKKRIDWKDKVMLAPLTTVGNLPFRRICKEFGADITCGEMALAPKLLKGAREEWALIKRHESEDVFGVQVAGNNPGVLTRCAQLLNDETEVDFVDLNLGCPIDLIYKQGAGCGMMNRLNILESVVKSAVEVLDIPFTIKTRTGVYRDNPIAHKLMPKFKDWGAEMINVSFIAVKFISQIFKISFQTTKKLLFYRFTAGLVNRGIQNSPIGNTLRNVPRRLLQCQYMEREIFYHTTTIRG